MVNYNNLKKVKIHVYLDNFYGISEEKGTPTKEDCKKYKKQKKEHFQKYMKNFAEDINFFILKDFQETKYTELKPNEYINEIILEPKGKKLTGDYSGYVCFEVKKFDTNVSPKRLNNIIQYFYEYLGPDTILESKYADFIYESENYKKSDTFYFKKMKFCFEGSS